MLFVGSLKVSDVSAVPLDAAAVKPYVSDGVVREFTDWQEAREFAANGTDYIGNLPGPEETGTWLRFSDTGLNIVGEEHDYVTLDQTTRAVRSTNFIDEQFASDVLSDGSHFKAAYLAENTAMLLKFGVNPATMPDLKVVGGESLLPKIADTVAELVPYFNRTSPMWDMTEASDAYIGKPDQRYLKIGWGWAKDLAGHADTEAKQTLAAVVAKHDALLDPFITGLPVDGYLGDALMKDIHADKYVPLLELCMAYVPAMVELAYHDPGLSGTERDDLKKMPLTTVLQQQKMFGRWRNLYFAKAVENAAARGVRYAGMGDYHRAWLQKKGRVPATAHVYSFDRLSFKAVVAETARLRSS